MTTAKEKINIKKLQKLEKLISENTDAYPIREFIENKKSHKNLVDIIVKTILSQNTNDRLRDLAFSRLKSEFPNLLKILNAEDQKVIELIRICGLPQIKLERIKNALRRILEEFRNPDELCKMGKEKAFLFLTSIRGIGPKSAEVILFFGCGFDAFPVDTHVSRIIRRIGIVSGSREKIFKLCSPHIKNKILVHVFLIHHGKKICTARNPKCSLCIFKNMCNFRAESKLCG